MNIGLEKNCQNEKNADISVSLFPKAGSAQILSSSTFFDIFAMNFRNTNHLFVIKRLKSFPSSFKYRNIFLIPL
jgi:hypothetical protein